MNCLATSVEYLKCDSGVPKRKMRENVVMICILYIYCI